MYVVVHNRVDVDAVVSAYILKHLYPVEKVVTLDDLARIPKGGKVILADVRPSQAELDGYEVVAVYDHHDSKEPSASHVIWKRHRNDPRWRKGFDLLVEMADAVDVGLTIMLPRWAKLFHLSSYITALRSSGYSDETIIREIFLILDDFMPYLDSMSQPPKAKEECRIYELGRLKVAVVKGGAAGKGYVFDNYMVDFVIYECKQGIGIIRSIRSGKYDLNRIKDALRRKLREKGKEEEFGEWFFHPLGSFACRGSRTYPVRSKSVLEPEDLVEVLREVFAE